MNDDYKKRRHVIFVTPQQQDYVRVSEGDTEFPRSHHSVVDGVRIITRRTDAEIVEWAIATAAKLSKELNKPGFSFRTEEW